MIRIRLDEIMAERGWTNKFIETETGISRNTVKALVSNSNTRIDFPTLNALCNKLNLTPADIIEFTPDKE